MVNDITTYQPKFNESFFFDANVWIFLFCAIAGTGKRKQNLYSDFLNDLNRRKLGVYVNSLVVSEFANRYLRIEFELWKKESENFRADYKKDFIATDKYRETIVEVISAIRKILALSERASDNFQAVEMENIFNELETCDFNDSYYIELARLNNWIIVTDDADFFGVNQQDIKIITANI